MKLRSGKHLVSPTAISFVFDQITEHSYVGEGLHRNQIQHGCYSLPEINEVIEQLLESGHIYSTIDWDTFKDTNIF